MFWVSITFGEVLIRDKHLPGVATKMWGFFAFREWISTDSSIPPKIALALKLVNFPKRLNSFLI